MTCDAVNAGEALKEGSGRKVLGPVGARASPAPVGLFPGYGMIPGLRWSGGGIGPKSCTRGYREEDAEKHWMENLEDITG
jgi:hypothetical protein